jgi:hypothetical protein
MALPGKAFKCGPAYGLHRMRTSYVPLNQYVSSK